MTSNKDRLPPGSTISMANIGRAVSMAALLCLPRAAGTIASASLAAEALTLTTLLACHTATVLYMLYLTNVSYH